MCEGFKKMYLAEVLCHSLALHIVILAGQVLGKLPVIQHFLFGSLLPATWEEERRLKAAAAAVEAAEAAAGAAAEVVEEPAAEEVAP